MLTAAPGTLARPAPMPPTRSDLLRLRNLGPVSVSWLHEIGIRSEAELRAMGSVTAFRLITLRGHRPGLNLVYAIEGALRGKRWDSLPPQERERLRAAASSPWDLSDLADDDL